MQDENSTPSPYDAPANPPVPPAQYGTPPQPNNQPAQPAAAPASQQASYGQPYQPTQPATTPPQYTSTQSLQYDDPLYPQQTAQPQAAGDFMISPDVPTPAPQPSKKPFIIIAAAALALLLVVGLVVAVLAIAGGDKEQKTATSTKPSEKVLSLDADSGLQLNSYVSPGKTVASWEKEESYDGGVRLTYAPLDNNLTVLVRTIKSAPDCGRTDKECTDVGTRAYTPARLRALNASTTQTDFPRHTYNIPAGDGSKVTFVYYDLSFTMESNAYRERIVIRGTPTATTYITYTAPDDESWQANVEAFMKQLTVKKASTSG